RNSRKPSWSAVIGSCSRWPAPRTRPARPARRLRHPRSLRPSRSSSRSATCSGASSRTSGWRGRNGRRKNRGVLACERERRLGTSRDYPNRNANERPIMAFIVAFWNVQRWTANSDAHKTQVVTDTIKKIDADVLFLEESHSSVEDIMSGIGYAPLGFVNTLTVDGNGTQLQITGWRKSASHVVTTEGRVLRMPKSD